MTTTSLRTRKKCRVALTYLRTKTPTTKMKSFLSRAKSEFYHFLKSSHLTIDLNAKRI
jgi:hypothetical protein